MPELICDTSVLQYLHQVDELKIIDLLSNSVIVPPAVVEELKEGRKAGVDLPDLNQTNWIEVRHPAGEVDVPLITDMGPGETEVLMLAIEDSDSVAVLDDKIARKAARMLGITFTGTLGLLLDGKKGDT